MIVLEIENIKEFMVCLFQGGLFDRFRVSGCEVTTFVNFSTDGRQNTGWYDTDACGEDEKGFVPWRRLKPLVFSLIRGKKTPEKMVVDFCRYMPDGDMGTIRMQFEKGELFLYTGYMQKEFSPDKSKQQDWDEKCAEYMKENKIIVK